MDTTTATTPKTIELSKPRVSKSGAIYRFQTGPFDNGGAANSWGYERLAKRWTVIKTARGKFYVLTSN